ncbi:hypothetical protein BJ322DRAFT_1214897 [Thelephora terrestris]|uniref:F-box domain-containing protein n=1 Tax=Thelephora terrestris TaxID=56493 RepID=A0A9P6L1N5_9AGAM|nr:hypothetical protein BJ322DRAFT_1214897 [Thelephora terrestris]
MGDVGRLVSCGQKLINLSNGLSIGDLSDYCSLLESLHHLRYAILACRNDQLPINRLPVEILTLICELSLPWDSESEPEPPDNKRVFSVMRLTHVCKRWRLVLVSSPGFWTDFCVVKATPKFLAECLQRSETLPIHVSFKWDGSDPDYASPSPSVADDDGSVANDDRGSNDGDGSVADEDDNSRTSSGELENSDGASSHSTWSIYPDPPDKGDPWTDYVKEAQGYYHLIQQSHRIATLDISLPAVGYDEDEEERNSSEYGLLFYPLPALQTLRLRCFSRSDGSIPQAILDEHIATVKSLYLENILPTQILDFSLNITSLTLKATGAGSEIGMDSFLRFLGKNQALQSLTLRDYRFSPVPQAPAPVALNNLRHLHFSCTPVTILRHLAALPLGSQSFFRIERERLSLRFLAENSAAGTSTLVTGFFGEGTDSDGLLSTISDVFGFGWEEATQVVVATYAGGWEREFADKFLARLTRLDDLFLECPDDRVVLWFDSLGASKERCPKLRRVRLCVAPEFLPVTFRSVRRLAKQRAEDGIPLETVEQTDPSPSAEGIWNDLYHRWRIEDYLKPRDSL